MKTKKSDTTMAKTYVDAVKYMIKIHFSIKGIVDKPDIVGAVFGQSEGLLGEEMDLRELQKKGRVGRIEVNIRQEGGSTNGEILVPTSMDMAETSVLAAAIETVDKVGPCESQFQVMNIEDVRRDKRQDIAKRAKELLTRLKMEQSPEIDTLTEEIRSEVRAGNLVEYGRDRLAAGPEVETAEEVIVVEGRADVVNLLKHGIKNVIGMGGSRISQDIIHLSRKKSIVLFVDGDRGGELNARKLHQIANIPFVAVAPDGKEVEELQQKEIIQALRRRIPIQSFLDSIGVSAHETQRGMNGRSDSFHGHEQRRAPSERMDRGSPFSPRMPHERGMSRSPFMPRGIKPRFGDRDIRPVSTMEEPLGEVEIDFLPSPVATPLRAMPALRASESSLSPEFEALLSQVKGKKIAKFLDEKKKEVAFFPVRDMVSKLKEVKSVHTIVCDGIITKRLVDAAAKSNVQLIVGVKKGKIDNSPIQLMVSS